MHISATYTQVRALAEQIGELSLPPLANSPGRPSDSKFTEEINRTGVYVHKLSHDLDALQGMDQTLAKQMLKSRSYRQEGIEQALKFGSPNVVGPAGKDQDDYARRTLEDVITMPQVKKDSHQKRTRGPSLDR